MTTTTKTKRAQLNLEGLEIRTTPTVNVVNGDLVINGRGFNLNDNVDVRYEVHGGQGWFKVTENGVVNWRQAGWGAGKVNGGDVFFYGYSGNDTFRNFTSLRTTAYGHEGNDTLIGGYSRDYLNGGSGHDTLNGRDDGIRDTLVGGTGFDKFQNDHFWIGPIWFNRDAPSDYNVWYDSLYQG